MSTYSVCWLNSALWRHRLELLTVIWVQDQNRWRIIKPKLGTVCGCAHARVFQYCMAKDVSYRVGKTGSWLLSSAVTWNPICFASLALTYRVDYKTVSDAEKCREMFSRNFNYPNFIFFPVIFFFFHQLQNPNDSLKNYVSYRVTYSVKVSKQSHMAYIFTWVEMYAAILCKNCISQISLACKNGMGYKK